jgi:hypothetical protein
VTVEFNQPDENEKHPENYDAKGMFEQIGKRNKESKGNIRE